MPVNKITETIPSNEKIVIISDLHLGKRLLPAKLELLKRVIESADRVIINGDLWEGFWINYQDFLASDWRQLFPLFRAKYTIYITGNHDPVPEASELPFCQRCLKDYTFVQNNQTFHLMHGDAVDKTFDLRHPVVPRKWLYVGVIAERALINLLGQSFLNIYRRNNRLLTEWARRHINQGEWLICGHTHLPVIDQAYRYANSGIFNQPGSSSYLVIQNGKIELSYI